MGCLRFSGRKNSGILTSFLLQLTSTIYCKWRELCLHLVTFKDTYIIGTSPPNKGSARRRGLYLHNTQHSHDANIHAAGRIRTHNTGKRAPADLRLRPRGHWDRQCSELIFLKVPLSYARIFTNSAIRKEKKGRN